MSLRDVERTMDVMTWFYKQRDTLFPLMGSCPEEQDNSDNSNVRMYTTAEGGA